MLPTVQPVVQAAQVAQTAQPAAPANTTIQQLLRNFSKLPTGERYSADSEKVKLLEDYLWIRQLTPSLPFETFLSLYAPIADFDEENLKHPVDAIKHYLPRAKKVADDRQLHHWAAKEVVDFVALYVDMIREAETKSTPLPMTFNEFLQSAPLISMFLAGDFKEPSAPKAPSTPRTPRAAKGNEQVRPSGVGQRVIYTATSGRQHRGELTAYWQDPQSSNVFADFRSDAGEDFKGIGINSFEVCSDPPPNVPQTISGDALPELAHGKLIIVKAQYPSVVQALALSVPLGTVALGEVIYGFNHQFSTGHVAVIEVVNGNSGGPYVDARLCLNTPDNVLAEINPPRKSIEGIYIFETPAGTFNLEVVGNQ